MPVASKAPTRRRYRSGLREQQAATTKRAVVEAARDLFVARGWAGTGMRDIASAAGVALETVYSHFSSKPGLLRAVIDTAVVGDDEPVPLAERPGFLAIGKGSRASRLRAVARVLTEVHVRSAALTNVVRQAASGDDDIAALLRGYREQQRSDVAAALSLVLGRRPTREERDGAWAISSADVYVLLVHESGWTPERFETWFAETLGRVLPRS